MRHDTGVLAVAAEPVIENDLPLDLSCNSAQRQRDSGAPQSVQTSSTPPSVAMMMAAAAAAASRRIGGPPSPPRSPVDFRAHLSDTLGYVAYHRHLMVLQQQQVAAAAAAAAASSTDPEVDVGEDDLLEFRRRRHRRHSADEIAADSASDDSESDSPMDLGLGAPAKAYKKSLMKRYRKFASFFFCFTQFYEFF